MTNRKKLIHYALKYQGNYIKVLKAFNKDEFIDGFLLCDNAITIFDEIYPVSLKKLKQPPLVLFYKGNIELINNECISIVGAREITTYTQRVLNAIIPEISKRYTTVSGLAIGVDSCVHQLSANNTIAVLGCGIDYIYPLSNHHLFTVMANKHLILSEYPDKVKPMKTNFPFRNRIIVGLSKKLIVAQARIKSGTMHSVNYALEIDNDIYVIPHMFDDEKGLGSNLLIKEGANILLTSDIKML